jgi:hypothetical protein
MSSIFNKIAAALVGFVLIASVQGAFAQGAASPDEIAKYIAGIQPSADSPLAKFAKDANWQQHARAFDTAWKELERKQLSKIGPWVQENLKNPSRPLFYMFSGPDYLYANAFFPNASTYVMAGLEPTGPIPVITERSRYSLTNLRSSLGTVLNISFFITSEMSSRLREGELKGTLPILYVFLARAGKTIQEVTLVTVDKAGNIVPTNDAASRQRALSGGDQGVKIVFTGPGTGQQTLYYFSTDLSDGGTKNGGFLKFAEKLGTGDALIKSASYLLHASNFSRVRDFLINHAQTIAQDDTGIPLRFFKKEEWQLKPYGAYLGPIEVFPGMFQPQLAQLFRSGKPPKLDFGIGYRWRGHDSNLLVAVKKSVVAGGQ